MEISGTIIAVLPTRSGTSAKGTQWQSQTAVLETQEQYPKRVAFDVLNGNITRFNLHVGDNVLAKIDIDAHETNGRWFNNIRCWDLALNIQGPINANMGQTPTQPQQSAPQAQPAQAQAAPQNDSVPF